MSPTNTCIKYNTVKNVKESVFDLVMEKNFVRNCSSTSFYMVAGRLLAFRL